MKTHKLIVHFDETSQARANQYASELRENLLDLYLQDVSVDVVRESQNTMDLGGILEIVLAAPAVVALARGIQAWLSKRPTASIRIVRPDGTVIAIAAEDSRNLAKIVEALSASPSPGTASDPN